MKTPIESHASYVTTTYGGAGWFAVLTWWNPHPGFWEPWQTGIGRYRTSEDAEKEARAWAEADELEYRP